MVSIGLDAREGVNIGHYLILFQPLSMRPTTHHDIVKPCMCFVWLPIAFSVSLSNS